MRFFYIWKQVQKMCSRDENVGWMSGKAVKLGKIE